eukprot:6178810-Pleurochrysis_carterae.AAC.1
MQRCASRCHSTIAEEKFFQGILRGGNDKQHMRKTQSQCEMTALLHRNQAGYILSVASTVNKRSKGHTDSRHSPSGR